MPCSGRAVRRVVGDGEARAGAGFAEERRGAIGSGSGKCRRGANASLRRPRGQWRNNAIAPYYASAISSARGQLVDDERLDEDRIFVRELGAESGFVDQLAEQVEIGIR